MRPPSVRIELTVVLNLKVAPRSCSAFAIVAYNGDIYSGLWYPIVIALATVVIGAVFLRESKDVDLNAGSEPELDPKAKRPVRTGAS